MFVFLTILFFLTSVTLGALLYRAVQRLLQYDRIFEETSSVLQGYGNELQKTLSAGLLEDHPEVRAFHRLNQLALSQILQVTQAVVEVAPKKKQRLPPNALPPLVE